MRSGRNKDKSGLSYQLRYKETCVPALSEHVQSTTFGLLVEASLFRLTGSGFLSLNDITVRLDLARLSRVQCPGLYYGSMVISMW